MSQYKSINSLYVFIWRNKKKLNYVPLLMSKPYALLLKFVSCLQHTRELKCQQILMHVLFKDDLWCEYIPTAEWHYDTGDAHTDIITVEIFIISQSMVLISQSW